MIYRMRAILDTETDVIRDFEIEANATLEELHDAVSPVSYTHLTLPTNREV